ncbi:MAG: hypothetical protein EOO77_18405 [Oxalobacteraceae bacterium]|nr:MAG: hypothetical protein EOO77_18405 [Oxalobacteraceae bacterium]
MVETLAAYAGILQERAENAEGRGDGCDLLRASELRDRCLAMGTSYEAFRARWAHRHALDHWPEYRLSAVHMMKRIRDDVVFSNTLHRTGIVPAT